MKRNLLFSVLTALSFNASAIGLNKSDSTLTISGYIAKGDSGKIYSAMSDPDIKKIVFSNVVGGDADTTVVTLSLFEEKQAEHEVDGYCRSSCIMWYLASNKRKVKLGSYLGFHSVYNDFGGNIHARFSDEYKRITKRFLKEKYDPEVFDFIFDQMFDRREFYVFSGGPNNGSICRREGYAVSSISCTKKTNKTMEELGLSN